jgi:hypothetical protein
MARPAVPVTCSGGGASADGGRLYASSAVPGACLAAMPSASSTPPEPPRGVDGRCSSSASPLAGGGAGLGEGAGVAGAARTAAGWRRAEASAPATWLSVASLGCRGGGRSGGRVAGMGSDTEKAGGEPPLNSRPRPPAAGQACSLQRLQRAHLVAHPKRSLPQSPGSHRHQHEVHRVHLGLGSLARPLHPPTQPRAR